MAKVVKKTKKKTGRIKPKWQTKKNAAMIFAAMCEGKSLREVCRNNDWPLTTVYDWLSRDYAEQYADAQAQRADNFFEELLEIADAPCENKVEVMQANMRIETRKWVMSRMNPKKYGNKVGVEMSGKVKATHDGTVEFTPTDLAIQRIDEIISKAVGSGKDDSLEDISQK